MLLSCVVNQAQYHWLCHLFKAAFNYLFFKQGPEEQPLVSAYLLLTVTIIFLSRVCAILIINCLLVTLFVRFFFFVFFLASNCSRI